MFSYRFFIILLSLVLNICVATTWATDSGSALLKAVLRTDGGAQSELRTWDISALKKLKQVTSQERDPQTGTLAFYHGPLLSAVIDDAMVGLPPEKKAQVDLVILKGTQGQYALIPRGFIVKYPFLLAFNKEKNGLNSVAPTTSRPGLFKEGAPLATFFLIGVDQIELANYQDRYGPYFLKRRTDPAAMRGEKFFMQNCLVCHSNGVGPSVVRLEHWVADHSKVGKVRGLAKPGDKDMKSLMSYLQARQAEKPHTK